MPRQDFFVPNRIYNKILDRGSFSANLVPRAHVPFGQHEDTEGADQKVRGLWERDWFSARLFVT